jgi:predicted RNA-binding Zn-ribbon protein involved in translation (DUF1610 family)
MADAKRRYAICPDCGQEMSPETGCTKSTVMIGGEEYERIPFGDDRDFDPDMEEGDVCHDCNAGIGQYHHAGCDAERCPACGDQFISCDCE